MPLQHNSYVAAVNVPVSVFVRRATGAGNDFLMQPCIANEVADLGVSHEGSQDTMLPGDSSAQLAARQGTSCRVYGLGETCLVFAGANIQRGQRLKPNVNGHAVPAAATDQFSAIANQTVVSGQKVSVTIQFGALPA